MGRRAGASCCACEWTSGLAVGRPVKQIVDRAPPRPYDPALYTVRRQDLVPVPCVRYCTRGMVTPRLGRRHGQLPSTSVNRRYGNRMSNWKVQRL